ncbi:MAG: hypothetical protein RBR78_08325 [Flavobacteriaceae bacterium]|jgi:hypothetical protein|nr:hypothetical protein [Flavobacteriaceae bacterium]
MTDRKRRNKVNSLSVYALVIIFMGTMLFEPLHYFIFSHKHIDTTHHETKPSIHSVAENCPVCDFHFCFFINDALIYREKYFGEYILKTNDKIVNKNTVSVNLHKKGRAPPVW